MGEYCRGIRGYDRFKSRWVNCRCATARLANVAAATIVTQLDYFNADTVRFFPGVSVAIRCLIALHCNETSSE